MGPDSADCGLKSECLVDVSFPKLPETHSLLWGEVWGGGSRLLGAKAATRQRRHTPHPTPQLRRVEGRSVRQDHKPNREDETRRIEAAGGPGALDLGRVCCGRREGGGVFFFFFVVSFV